MRFYGPIALQVHITVQNAFNFIFRLEPASLAARASGGYLPPTGQRFNHPFNVVVAIGRFLPLAGAQHPIAGHKNAHRHARALDQVQGQPQGVVRSFVAVGASLMINR
jgi:hypothetical protein